MDDMMNVTVGKLLEQVAEKYPDDEAVKFTDRDYRRTWKEFNEEAETIAKGFLEMGIRKGDHVAIWATNVPEWMLTFSPVPKSVRCWSLSIPRIKCLSWNTCFVSQIQKCWL